jgi:hypothetical protein
MQGAVISGDIIAWTSLSVESRIMIERGLDKLLQEIEVKYDVFGRIVKGDYIECVIPDPGQALRVALAIKCFVKAIKIEDTETDVKNNRIRAFRTYGIRLAIGYGQLTRYDKAKGIIDGEAIYYSGRIISDLSTYNKHRMAIKDTIYFASADNALNNTIDPIIALLDHTLMKATGRQSKVLYMKLMGLSEVEIANELAITQSVVNQHSTAVGWNAIEKAVLYFKELFTKEF